MVPQTEVRVSFQAFGLSSSTSRLSIHHVAKGERSIYFICCENFFFFFNFWLAKDNQFCWRVGDTLICACALSCCAHSQSFD